MGKPTKLTFQAKRRFWEDLDIYGGISWSNTKSRRLWYTHGIHKAKGIVLSAYDYGGGMYHTMMSQDERIEAHLADLEKFTRISARGEASNDWLASHESYAGLLGQVVT